MKALWRQLRGCCADEVGVTAIEYAFLGSLIAMVAIAAIAAVGPMLTPAFERISNSMPSGSDPDTGPNSGNGNGNGNGSGNGNGKGKGNGGP